MLISHKAEKVKQIERRSVFSGPLPVKQVFFFMDKNTKCSAGLKCGMIFVLDSQTLLLNKNSL